MHLLAGCASSARQSPYHGFIGEDLAGWQQWWNSNQNKTEPQFREDLLSARANELDALKRHNADLESDFAAFLDDEYQLTPPAQRGDKLFAYLTAPNAIMRAEGARIAARQGRGGER